jgi:hypothetical protein
MPGFIDSGIAAVGEYYFSNIHPDVRLEDFCATVYRLTINALRAVQASAHSNALAALPTEQERNRAHTAIVNAGQNRHTLWLT